MIKHETSQLGTKRLEEAKSICCEYWNVDKNVVFTKTRLRNIINARHSIRYMLTTQNKFSLAEIGGCLLYTSPSPRDRTRSRMPSSA